MIFTRWSVWHRIPIAGPQGGRRLYYTSRRPEVTLSIVDDSGAIVPSSPGRPPLPAIAECGIAFPVRGSFQEWDGDGPPSGLRCATCFRLSLLARVPPLGSPGGEPLRRRDHIVFSSVKRRPRLNHPSA